MVVVREEEGAFRVFIKSLEDDFKNILGDCTDPMKFGGNTRYVDHNSKPLHLS